MFSVAEGAAFCLARLTAPLTSICLAGKASCLWGFLTDVSVLSGRQIQAALLLCTAFSKCPFAG